MASLVLMMGVAGSGKTTYAKKMMKDCDIYVSRDEIRFGLVKEDEPYFSKEDEVLQTFIRTIDNALLTAQRYVIADATHINEVSRMKLIKRIDLSKCKVSCIVLLTDELTAIKRNHLRKGRARVPDSVISENYARFTHPKADKFHYHNIIEVN